MDKYIDREKLVMTISGTISEVAKETPYDREWFSRMAARQAEIINIIYNMPAADVVDFLATLPLPQNARICIDVHEGYNGGDRL